MERAGVLNALVMVVALQASVNLYNSFDDYMNGVDTVEDSGDRWGREGGRQGGKEAGRE